MKGRRLNVSPWAHSTSSVLEFDDSNVDNAETVEHRSDTKDPVDHGMSRLDSVRGAIVIGTLAAATLAYSFHLVSFGHAKLFALAVGTAFLSLLGFRATRIAPSHRAALAVFSCVAIAITAQGLLHRQWPELRDVLPLLCMGLFALLSADLFESEAFRLRALDAVAWTALLCASLAVAQFAGLLTAILPEYPGSGVYSVFGNSGLLGGFLAIALPIQLMRYLRSASLSVAHLMFTCLLVGALLLTGARTAWLAATVGCALVTIGKRPAGARVFLLAACLAAVSTACVFAAPQFTVERIASTFSPGDAGANLRKWFWLGAWHVFEENPVAGIGLGRFQYWGASYLGNVLWEPGGERIAHNILHVEHPHNEYLAILAEFGAAGVAIVLVLAVLLARRRGPEWPPLAALFVFALFNAPFHSVPHALAGTMLATSLLSRGNPSLSARPFSDRKRVIYGGVLFAAAVAVLIGVGIAVVVPSYRLAAADIAAISGPPPLDLYRRACAGPFALPEAHERYGAALLRAGRYAEARDTFTRALTHLDWGSAYLGLAAAQRKLGNLPAARAAAEACVQRWPSHTDAWQILLSAAPTTDHADIVARAKRFGVQVRGTG